MKRIMVQIFVVWLGGVCGGFFAYVLLTNAKPSFAQSGVLKSSTIHLVDERGVVKGDLFSPPGSGAILDLYGPDGKLRIQMGSYGSGGEKGQPLAGLFDNQAQLRLLLRLAGKNESPVLVLKDSKHRDRMVLGLGLDDPKQEPFLAYFDDTGKKHLVFGTY